MPKAKAAAKPCVVVIGAGPTGLIAAERLSAAGLAVTVHDRMPSFGRKLLMAGRGGLNLTHSEPFEAFLARYREAAPRLEPMLRAFSPTDLIAWAEGLGQPTFVGSSGRVFPKALKASPLLRAWLARLQGQGVTFKARSEWLGWDADGALQFRRPTGEIESVSPDATVLALGGASWPRLGSNGAWSERLQAKGVTIAPFRAANVGFDVAWSDSFRERFAGEPLKGIAVTFDRHRTRGEAMVTRYGLEGGVIYALSAGLRDAIQARGHAELWIDLRPDSSEHELASKLAAVKAGRSLSNVLRKAVLLSPVAINLLRETHGVALPSDPGALAKAIKGSRLLLTGAQPMDRAISTAGGVALEAVDGHLMLRALPGVFVAGEMLDWEAPTGGYLLQVCFSTGVAAADGVLHRLNAAI
jgi:uncharacterized flavoprotein (TIGR03862 family)